MKILTFILNFISFFAIGQNMSLEIHDGAAGFPHYAYYGVYNDLNLIVENESCDSIFLTTNNGEIIKDTKNKCSYRFTPKRFETTTILINKIRKYDTLLIGQKEIHLKPFPFTLIFGNHSGLTYQSVVINQSDINNQKLSIEALNTGLDAVLPISELTLDIIRNNKSIYTKEYKDLNIKYWRFNDEEISIIQPGDRIMIHNIIYQIGNVNFNFDQFEIWIKK